ncbi:hypothetical protein ACSBR1_017117 [Camellia fascicularis]
MHRSIKYIRLFLLVITLNCLELLYNLSLLLKDRLWIRLVVIPLFGQCHINNNLIDFHLKRFTFRRKRRTRTRTRTTNKASRPVKTTGSMLYQLSSLNSVTRITH